MPGPEQGGEVMQESDAEARFKTALQEFERVAGNREQAEAALAEAEVAAEEIEDDERKAEALAQVEALKQTL